MPEFNSSVFKDKNGRLTYADIPFDAKDTFNSVNGSIYVSGTVNGFPFKSKLISRGGKKHIMIVEKELQKAIGFRGNTMQANFSMEADETVKDTLTLKPDVLTNCGIDALIAISQRLNIRKFTDQQIDEKQLNTILNAGFSAPSARNKRPWHFVVIKNKDLLTELSLAGNGTQLLSQASCCIAVCGDKNIEGIKEFLYEGCSSAIQNMLVCIQAIGLGGVWCGIIHNSDFSKLIINQLAIPSKIIPVGLIAIGYPDVNNLSPIERFEPCKVHTEKW